MNDSLDLATSPGQREDRKRDPEKLKSVKRNHAAQVCVASLKDAEHPEIDEPKKFGAGHIEGQVHYFGTKRGNKKR